MTRLFYFEDLVPGQTFVSRSRAITAEAIKAFAMEFDPQPFHTDEAAAERSFFKGLAASGWHTAALTMRLMLDREESLAGGLIGAGMEELRWPRPTRPGDVLTVESEVLELRLSKSRPEIGLVRMRNTTFNQDREPVQIFTGSLVVQRRTTGG